MRGAKVEKFFPRKELNERAQVTVVDSTPIRFYIRTAEYLFKQVSAFFFQSFVVILMIVFFIQRYNGLTSFIGPDLSNGR
jgi:hypothetical protein